MIINKLKVVKLLSVCLKKPDRYDQCDITSPIHNIYFW